MNPLNSSQKFHLPGENLDLQRENVASIVDSDSIPAGATPATETVAIPAKPAEPTNVKPTRSVPDQAKITKHLIALKSYFNQHHLNFWEDFQNLKVIQVVELAALDLLSVLFEQLDSKKESLGLEDEIFYADTQGCIKSIFKEMILRNRKMIHIEHLDNALESPEDCDPIPSSFIKLSKHLPAAESATYEKHIKTIAALLEIKSLKSFISEHTPPKEKQKPSKENAVSPFLSRCATRASKMITAINHQIKNRLQDELKTTSHMRQNDVIKAQKCLELFRPDTKIQWKKDSPLRECLLFMQSTHDYTVATSDFLAGLYTSVDVNVIAKKAMAGLDTISDVLHGRVSRMKGIMDSLSLMTIGLQSLGTLNITAAVDKFLLDAAAVASLVNNLFYPTAKTLFQGLLPDWRETIDFDTAEVTKDDDYLLEFEEDEKEKAAVPDVKPHSSKRKAPKHKKTKQQTAQQSQAQQAPRSLRGIEPQEDNSPPAIRFFSQLKTGITSGIPRTRTQKAQANQYYSLELLIQSLGILQSPHCYNGSDLNLLGKVVMGYGALHASNACEQQTSVALLTKNPSMVLPHDQVLQAEWSNEDPNDLEVQLFRRETLDYRYPKQPDVVRPQVEHEWPQWLGFVANKLAPTEEERKVLWALPRRTDTNPTMLSAPQLADLQQKEREITSLEEEIRKLSTSQQGEQKDALIGIMAHLNRIKGFVQGISLMGQQRNLAFFTTGTLFSLQTIVEHTWICALSKTGLTDIVHKRAEDLHDIGHHLAKDEIGSNLTDPEKANVLLLDVRKAFEYLGYCAKPAVPGRLPQMLQELHLLAEGAVDDSSICPIAGKHGLDTEEAVRTKLNSCLTTTVTLITTVCKLVRQDVVAEVPQQ